MTTTDKTYWYTWIFIGILFMFLSSVFYWTASYMNLSDEKLLHKFAFFCAGSAGVFNFILDYFDPLVPVEKYAIDKCAGKLEEGGKLRINHYKHLKIPSIILVSIGFICEFIV